MRVFSMYQRRKRQLTGLGGLPRVGKSLFTPQEWAFFGTPKVSA
jgi:hypothetical protein